MSFSLGTSVSSAHGGRDSQSYSVRAQLSSKFREQSLWSCCSSCKCLQLLKPWARRDAFRGQASKQPLLGGCNILLLGDWLHKARALLTDPAPSIPAHDAQDSLWGKIIGISKRASTLALPCELANAADCSFIHLPASTSSLRGVAHASSPSERKRARAFCSAWK